MFGDVCGVSATRNPAPGQNLSDIFSKIFDIGDVLGHLRVSVSQNPAPGAKLFRSFFSKFITSAMFGDICGVSATRNPAPRAKFFWSFFRNFHYRRCSGTSAGCRQPEIRRRGKIFPIFFFKIFDIGDVRGRLRGVGELKSGAGANFF